MSDGEVPGWLATHPVPYRHVRAADDPDDTGFTRQPADGVYT